MAMEQMAVNWYFQAINLGLDIVSTPFDCLSSVLGTGERDPYINSLNRMIADGDTNHRFIEKMPGETAEEFSQRVKSYEDKLKENQVFAHVVQKGDTVEFITLRSQEEQARELLEKKYDPVISNRELAGNGETILQFKTQDADAAYMFQKRCEANRVPVKVEYVYDMHTQQDTYKIRFRESDSEKMNAIKRNVAIDMYDSAGSIRRTQIKYQRDSKLNALNRTLDRNNAGNYVVGRDGSVIKVEKNAVVITADGKSETVPATSPAYKDKVRDAVVRMDTATEMTKEQFEEYKKAPNKEDYIFQVEKESGWPKLSPAEREIYQKAERQRELVEAKLVMEHPDERVVSLNDYNNEESLHMFDSKTVMNYEAIEEDVEMEEEYINGIKELEQEYVAEEANIDIDIAADEIFSPDVDIETPDLDEEINMSEETQEI